MAGHAFFLSFWGVFFLMSETSSAFFILQQSKGIDILIFLSSEKHF